MRAQDGPRPARAKTAAGAWSSVTRSDDRWDDDPVGWAMPTACARQLRRAAAWTGAVAALGGALAMVVVAVTVWLTEAAVTGSATQAMRAGLLIFLAAQHGGVVLTGVPVGFVPLGLFALTPLLPWRAGRTAAAVADARGQRAELPAALFRLVAAYTVTCGGLLAVGRLGSAHAADLRTLVAAATVCGFSAGLGMRRELTHRDGTGFLPRRFETAARAAAAGLATLFVSAALLVAISLGVHAGSAMELSRAVGGGGLGGLGLLLVGVLCAPNAVVAASSLLVGPGFAVGSDTVVRLTGVHDGLLPSFPMLAALPTAGGPNPLLMSWAAVTALAAGAAVARAVGERGMAYGRYRQLLLAAALGGSSMAVLAWLAGGGVGDRRLAVIGASPWQAGLATGAQLLASGGLMLIIGQLVGLLRWRPASVRRSQLPDAADAAVDRDEIDRDEIDHDRVDHDRVDHDEIDHDEIDHDRVDQDGVNLGEIAAVDVDAPGCPDQGARRSEQSPTATGDLSAVSAADLAKGA